jgi:hypothetical protein
LLFAASGSSAAFLFCSVRVQLLPYAVYETKVSDQCTRSKCAGPPSVVLVNAEIRTDDLLIGAGGSTHTA